MSETAIQERALSRAITYNILLLVSCEVFLLALWFAWPVFLYVFLGVLLGVALKGCADWLAEKTGLGPGAAYAVVVASGAAVLGVLVWLLAPRVAEQASQLATGLPQAWARVQEKMDGYTWGRELLPALQNRLTSGNRTLDLTSLGGHMFDVLGGLIAALVVGLYGAASPEVYRNGLLQLVRPKRRWEFEKVLDKIVYALRWWTLGQLVPMFVLGIATTIGLWLMGVPLAFTLGLFTGIMVFIPYLGALAAMVPAALMGLLVSPMKMVWVVVFFFAVHIAEGYLITPLVQRKAVHLPPILTIVAQVLLWTLAGVLGVIVATPLVAALLVIFKSLLRGEAEGVAGVDSATAGKVDS